ncbi:MAG TPA: ATP-binding protein [Steroidobacteraceae bacterium]|nr:ATP-binding protein [Steroidobacteraceae bacterium]
MRRLHLKLYLAIIGTLLVFLACGALAWRTFAPPRGTLADIETASALAASLVEDARADDARRQAVLDSLAYQLRANTGWFAADSTAPVLQSGRVPALTREQLEKSGWFLVHGGPVYNVRLDGGGHLVVHPRRRLLLHGVHMGLLLLGIAGVLALLTYPISRGITARLERLRDGVQKFGGGDLATRVAVEGRDEVAALARSFNESADRVERLVATHKLLLANCSHELRTPLARMRLAIEKLPAGERASNPELVRGIVELDQLIGEMLLSSRLDAAPRLEHTEPVDLSALVAEEAAHFDRDVTAVPAIVPGDPTLLRRLVRNLLDNARAHAGGATEVRVEADAATARLVVEDAGPGVPEADRARIFEPFFRADGAARGGFGLGLAIVRQIAAAHRGAVEYRPRDGGGSRFEVTLPR